MDRKKLGFSKLSCLWVFRCDAMRCLLLVYHEFDRGGVGRGGVGRERQGSDGRASRKGKAEHRVLEKTFITFFFLYVFFKYYAEVEICESFKNFDFICIYR